MSAGLAKVYKNQRAHDPSNIDRAREIASVDDPIPVGILYRNPEVPCYEDLRASTELRTPELVRTGLRGGIRQVHRLAAGQEPEAQASA